MLDAQQTIDALVMEASAAPVKAQIRHWLDPESLPTPGWRSGFLMPEMVLTWLLDAQAREAQAEVCDPLARCLPLLEPDGADLLVKALLEGFQKAGADVRDKFVLIPCAALASPGLLLTHFCPLVLRWARRRRGRLAAFAIDALGAAITARPDARGPIFALGALYPTLRDAQRRSLAEAIMGHLEAAAQARRVAIGTLLDHATPTINIQDQRWRLSERPPLVEAMPVSPKGLRWWLEGEPVDAAPTTRGSSGHRARIKALSDQASATFEVICTRLRDATLSGRVWSAGGFTAHMLHHPLRACPARHMVWTALDDRGQPVGTFRPREDGALINVDDELFTTPHTWVRPAHPARLDAEIVGLWQAHFEYHDLQAPFDQLGRPMETCPSHLQRSRVYRGLDGIRWRDIHERPEAFAGGPWTSVLRMGWHVGWVRTLPGPSGAIDVVVRTSEATDDVEWLYCLQHQPSAITHNDFPSPRRADDRSLIPLGDLPPAIYAEIMHDVQRMFAVEQVSDGEPVAEGPEGAGGPGAVVPPADRRPAHRQTCRS
ncbi:MAG: DUF4132 domain-containing protein [Bradymonadia bacterium]